MPVDNIKKHYLDFADAEIVFEGFTLTIPDNRFNYGEDRFISFWYARQGYRHHHAY